MHETLAITALLVFVGWLILDSLRAQEKAIQICTRACDERHVQLLDQTVSVHRFGVRWGSEGIRLRRIYHFDFSEDGEGRHTGSLILVGTRLEEISMGLASNY